MKIIRITILIVIFKCLYATVQQMEKEVNTKDQYINSDINSFKINHNINQPFNQSYVKCSQTGQMIQQGLGSISPDGNCVASYNNTVLRFRIQLLQRTSINITFANKIVSAIFSKTGDKLFVITQDNISLTPQISYFKIIDGNISQSSKKVLSYSTYVKQKIQQRLVKMSYDNNFLIMGNQNSFYILKIDIQNNSYSIKDIVTRFEYINAIEWHPTIPQFLLIGTGHLYSISTNNKSNNYQNNNTKRFNQNNKKTNQYNQNNNINYKHNNSHYNNSQQDQNLNKNKNNINSSEQRRGIFGFYNITSRQIIVLSNQYTIRIGMMNRGNILFQQVSQKPQQLYYAINILNVYQLQYNDGQYHMTYLQRWYNYISTYYIPNNPNSTIFAIRWYQYDNYGLLGISVFKLNSSSFTQNQLLQFKTKQSLSNISQQLISQQQISIKQQQSIMKQQQNIIKQQKIYKTKQTMSFQCIYNIQNYKTEPYPFNLLGISDDGNQIYKDGFNFDNKIWRYSRCGDNMYVLNNECLNCSSSCKSCHKSSTQCRSCNNGTYYDNQACERCESKYSGCLLCDSQNCTYCDKFLMFYEYPSNGRCKCINSSYYIDQNANKCKKCSQQIYGCLQCDNGSNCTLCDWMNKLILDNSSRKCVCFGGYIFVNGVCIQDKSILDDLQLWKILVGGGVIILFVIIISGIVVYCCKRRKIIRRGLIESIDNNNNNQNNQTNETNDNKIQVNNNQNDNYRNDYNNKYNDYHNNKYQSNNNNNNKYQYNIDPSSLLSQQNIVNNHNHNYDKSFAN